MTESVKLTRIVAIRSESRPLLCKMTVEESRPHNFVRTSNEPHATQPDVLRQL